MNIIQKNPFASIFICMQLKFVVAHIGEVWFNQLLFSTVNFA